MPRTSPVICCCCILLSSVCSFHSPPSVVIRRNGRLDRMMPLYNDAHSCSKESERTIDRTADGQYSVQVIHQGHSTTLMVNKDESILAALERQSTLGSSTDQVALGLSNIPHECRRGNCMTCATRVIEGVEGGNVRANVDNGLAPTVLKTLESEGYVLACSTFVSGEGLVIELDQNEQAWDLVYRQRPYVDPTSARLGMEARARVKRRLDEIDVPAWKKRTEKSFKDSP